MQKITPFLWFDTQAEEAANFYVSIFKNSQILSISHSTDGEKGKVFIVSFKLNGLKFLALNGGPNFKFTEAISLLIECKTQKEIDLYWEKLSEGGQPGQCGWLKDKYGLSWQVVPKALAEMMQGPDPEGSKRVMDAVMKMNKIELKVLKKAYNQK